jgi:hypothetical protein
VVKVKQDMMGQERGRIKGRGTVLRGASKANGREVFKDRDLNRVKYHKHISEIRNEKCSSTHIKNKLLHIFYVPDIVGIQQITQGV